MNCIKCGQEIAGSQVFCDECLADMEKHPVKPGTPVMLPPRDSHSTAKRQSRKRSMKPEELIAGLRKTVSGLLLVIIVLILALGLSVFALLWALETRAAPSNAGQRHSAPTSILVCTDKR